MGNTISPMIHQCQFFYGDLIDEDGETRNPSMKRSFRDTVTGKDSTSTDKAEGEKLMDDDNFEFTAEMFDGRIVVEEKMLRKHECPVFNLSKWEEARIQRPWRKGRKIGFKAL